MCHVKPDSEIGDCEYSPLIPPGLGVCVEDSSGVFRRVLRLLFEYFCEKFGILGVERPVGRCCDSVAGDV